MFGPLPPRTAKSSLQSNWNSFLRTDDQGYEGAATCRLLLSLPISLPAPGNRSGSAVRPVKTESHKVSMQLFQPPLLLARHTSASRNLVDRYLLPQRHASDYIQKTPYVPLHCPLCASRSVERVTWLKSQRKSTRNRSAKLIPALIVNRDLECARGSRLMNATGTNLIGKTKVIWSIGVFETVLLDWSVFRQTFSLICHQAGSPQHKWRQFSV